MTTRKFRPVEHISHWEASPEALATFQTLSGLVNRGGDKAVKEAAMLMAGDHRTLVQSFTAHFIVPFLLLLAQDRDEDRFDLRNDQATKLAKEITEAIDLDSYPLPFH